MKSSELTKPGFYWWQCPADDGPEYMRGRPKTIVQVGIEAFNMSSGDPCKDCFFHGSPHTFITRNLPGDFIGPIDQSCVLLNI